MVRKGPCTVLGLVEGESIQYICPLYSWVDLESTLESKDSIRQRTCVEYGKREYRRPWDTLQKGAKASAGSLLKHAPACSNKRWAPATFCLQLSFVLMPYLFVTFSLYFPINTLVLVLLSMLKSHLYSSPYCLVYYPHYILSSSLNLHCNCFAFCICPLNK